GRRVGARTSASRRPRTRDSARVPGMSGFEPLPKHLLDYHAKEGLRRAQQEAAEAGVASTAESTTTDPAVGDKPVGPRDWIHEVREVPPPSKPLAVARLFLHERMRAADVSLLRSHRGTFFAWTETCWPELEERALRSALYVWLEHAVDERGDDLV